MTIILQAVFENGAFHPAQAVELPEGASVRLTVESAASPAVSEPDSEINPDDPLEAVIGICKTGPPISLADRHDEFLYGLKHQDEDEP